MPGSAESAVDELADELYALPPDQFIAARDERVRQAREAGDRELATALGKLRRPTVSAWVVNLLARDQQDVLEQLLSLGDELREAQRELRGPALRELASRRQRVVSALVQTARRLAADAEHPVNASTAYEVEQTLHAALADPEVARRVCGGHLVQPASPTGFGDAELPATAEAPVRRLRAVAPPKKAGPASKRTTDAAPQRAEERRRAERERLQAEYDAAKADQEVAENELRAAEQRVTEVERARDEAAARIETLEEELRTAQREHQQASGAIREARRRREVAARVSSGTTERLTHLRQRLESLEDKPEE